MNVLDVVVDTGEGMLHVLDTTAVWADTVAATV